ncbi:hypothetical protein BPT24_134 [Tenacibaculum phage pT24]|uniref:Uncharacterized protein n=1 Tax=Tenacibaculum phage pT24 TaxID=1880590 RepID=A0A1B4XWT7_9CAUD|nr:hypothetical protein HYP10_gp134 [Tenacibaculum phage pT24]BAV39259.1 hypothetical protein BPT24_134 [Tenacibaculum phage pT24]
MKSLISYYNPLLESNINESLVKDDVIENFTILCKYADYFNSVEIQWHRNNKSTPNSRAIREETDKLFKIAEKAISSIYVYLLDDYSKNPKDFAFEYFDDDFMKGKKLATIIRRTDEWKNFYKVFKKFDGDTMQGYSNDFQIKNLIQQFIIISREFVDDVQT